MKIFYNGYFDLPHSWSSVAQNMTQAFMNFGHECKVVNCSPTGATNIPSQFKPLLNRRFKHTDLSWSYTAPFNWPRRFKEPCDFKAAMYAYESSILPKKQQKGAAWDNWGNLYQYVDRVLVPSAYVSQIFQNAGTPESRISIIPHGVWPERFSSEGPKHKLNTKKKFKFLAVATNLWRKNIRQLLQVYVKTFTKNDDVCLIIKTAKNDPTMNQQYMYDINPDLQACASVPNCPEIITLYGTLQQISPLYRACDCYVNVSASEGFGLPLLEAMACGLITIAPRYSGQLDFMNDNNSLLVDAKEIKADPRYQYWHYEPSAVVGRADNDDLADKMRYVYKNKEKVLKERKEEMRKTVEKFTWENAAQTMLEACKK